MVIVGRNAKKLGARRAGARRGRRVGQAMNGDMGDQAQFNEFVIDASNAQVAGEGEAFTLDDPEDGEQFIFASAPVGDLDGDGVEEEAEILVALPAMAQAEPAEELCEFPAQSLDLQRTVTITNSAPRVVDVNTDICGNVVSYTEQLTRNMQASAWVPLSGLQGRVGNFEVAADQEIFLQNNPGVDVANSRGFADLEAAGIPFNVTSQQLVGRRRGAARRAGARHVPNHNANAAYGAALMRKFRAA